MKNTIIRFFPFFRNKDKKHHGFLFLSLVIPLIGAILLGAGLLLFRPSITQYFVERSALLVDYYWFVLPLACAILFFHITTSVVQALYDTVLSSFLMNVVVRVLTALLLVIYFLGWLNFEQFIIIFVANYGLILLALLIYMFRNFEVSLLPNFDFLDRALIKKMFYYSIFAFFGGVASIIVSNVDIIMLSSLAGLEDTGIYAIAFYVGSAITITKSSIYKISSPVIADAFKEKDYDLIEQIYNRSSLNQIIAGGLLFCGVIANLDNLMSMLPPEYAGGALVIIIIGAANIFDMATGVDGAIILNSDHYRFDLYSTLILILLTVVLNYFLIPIYGIMGAAIGTAAAVIVYNGMKVTFIWVRFNMQPFQWRIIYILLIGAITLISIFQVPLIFNLYVDILIRSIIVTIMYIVPLWVLDISDELNQLINGALDNVRKYIF
jgi:O-antigen/teichoic acid export membrane protein